MHMKRGCSETRQRFRDNPSIYVPAAARRRRDVGIPPYIMLFRDSPFNIWPAAVRRRRDVGIPPYGVAERIRAVIFPKARSKKFKSIPAELDFVFKEIDV